jgi:hypothetical protein
VHVHVHVVEVYVDAGHVQPPPVRKAETKTRPTGPRRLSLRRPRCPAAEVIPNTG